MQDRLIQRYLGNKSAIVVEIVSAIKTIAEPGDLVFDAFAGTLVVAASLRQAGFRVATNDINHFTWSYANAYFSTAELPWPEVIANRRNKVSAWSELISELTVAYDGFPKKYQRSDIFDHYCEAGSKSGFISSRGKTGRRRFFSADNAKTIDRALSRIRYWHQKETISEQTRCILMASLLSAVEKVSNTQGTFHDFPREYVDPRARQPIALNVPYGSMFIDPPSSHIGKAEDTLDFVRDVPDHQVIYIDPPYNFRQYTSYYFMLNLLSEYPEIVDIEDYFDKVEFVRGQNMDNDFKSTFSSKRTFVMALRELIERARARYVMLSYFDGRNHWGSFKEDRADDKGIAMIEDLFRGELFVPGSLQCIPVSRLNYQSYGGHSAREVNEFLFIGEKSTVNRTPTCGGRGGLEREGVGSASSVA